MYAYKLFYVNLIEPIQFGKENTFLCCKASDKISSCIFVISKQKYVIYVDAAWTFGVVLSIRLQACLMIWPYVL